MFTFLFSDIEGSTKLWRDHGDAMRPALARHDALVLEAVAAHGGRVVKHTGDGFFVVFDNDDALAAALELQSRLQREDWGGGVELRVRLAVHVGEAEEREGDYFGPAVNLAARLAEAAWGGQTVLTAEAAAALPLPSGAALTDLGVHVLRDVGVPTHLYGLTRPDLPLNVFPPPRSAARRPGNLPPEATPFVGRVEELAQLRALLHGPTCRLLTLLGPGGTGKTRLALRLAADLADGFGWGAYFVPLAPVGRAEHVIGAVAEALRFPFTAGGDPRAQLLAYVAGKEFLLVLDGFEYVAAGTPLVSEIIAAAPAAKVVVTSRTRLHLQTERVYEVGGMAYAAAADALHFDDYGAARLFVGAARRVHPDFQLTPDERPAFLRLCKAVEGMPLALELAAGWARVLTVTEIAAEVAQGLGLMESQAADVPERHRSVRAVFDYSYGILTGEERQLLLRLAVFRGGFDRRAAAAVAGAALPALAALADKSLIRRAPEGRYDIHGLIREAAEEKLRADGAAYADARARHRDYYAAFLREQYAVISGARQQLGLAQTTAELDNVRAAWRYAVETVDIPALHSAVGGFYTYFYTRGLYSELRDEFGPAVTAVEPAASAPDADAEKKRTFVKLLNRYMMPLVFMGDLRGALPLARRALTWARRLDDTYEIVFALNALAILATFRGRNARARRLSEYFLERSRRAGYAVGVYLALSSLAHIAGDEGDDERARDLFQASLREAGPDIPPNRLGILNINLAQTEERLGNFSAAKDFATRALGIGEETGNRRIICFALHNVALATAALGEYDAARRNLERTLPLARELNEPLTIPAILTDYGDVLAYLGEREAATRALTEAVRLVRESEYPPASAFCFTTAAYHYAGWGEVATARAYLREAVTALPAPYDRRALRVIVTAAARWFGVAGPPGPAAEALGAATLLSLPYGRRRDLEALGDRLAAAMGREEFDAAAARGRAMDAGVVVARLTAALGAAEGAATPEGAVDSGGS